MRATAGSSPGAARSRECSPRVLVLSAGPEKVEEVEAPIGLLDRQGGERDREASASRARLPQAVRGRHSGDEIFRM